MRTPLLTITTWIGTAVIMSGCALILPGCVVNEYDIEMEATGEGLERTLRIGKAGAQEPQLSEAELNRIRDEYHQPELEKVEPGYRYHSTFSRRLPNDVGGYGVYRRLDSPCGSTMLYVERFRGDDDLVSLLERRRRAIQESVDLLAGWLATETEGQPESGRFLDFLRTTFQHDLENLSVYLLTTDLWVTFGELNDLNESPVSERLALYLLERDYFTLDELPVTLRAIRTNDVSRIVEQLKAVVIRKLKLDAAQGEQLLAFLNDREAAFGRLEDYLRTTPQFRELQAALPENERGDVQAIELFSGRVLIAFFPPGTLSGHDVVTAHLKLPVLPWTTNGATSDNPPEIEWEFRIEPKPAETGRQLPQLAFAFWAQPDVDYQRTHFGKTVLDGQDLGQFNLWYHGLSAAEQQEWETFLTSQRPGRQLVSNMKAFRFSSERTAAKPAQTEPLVIWPVTLIERKLNRP